MNPLSRTPEEKAINRLVGGVYRRLNHKNALNQLPTLPSAERAVLTCIALDTEVKNGGFHQYFWNSYGNDTRLALEDLAVIGATEAHALLTEASSLFPGSLVPERRADRWAAMDRWNDHELTKLTKLDMAYYTLGWCALTVRLHRFLTEHGKHLLEPTS